MLRVAGVSAVLAMIIIVGTGLQDYLELTLEGEQNIDVFRMVRWRIFWWFGWVLITPIFYELAWRTPLRRTSWPTTLPLLAVYGVCAFALHLMLQIGAMYLPIYRMVHPTFMDAVRYHFVISIYLNLFIYGVIVLVANSLLAYGEAQRRALMAAHLQTQLANARLNALRMQLHPHFLFNTLHGISTLMYRDVNAADAMVNGLSRLLRKALDRSDQNEVTVREEADFLKEYLDIERIRFGDDLDVRFEIDPDVEQLLVPSFVLQPLVENSIKHGITPSGNRGRISVSAVRSNGRLRLSVADNGPGIPGGDDALGAGLGLANLSDRLENMYGQHASLDLASGPDSGFRATVTIPIRPSSRDSSQLSVG